MAPPIYHLPLELVQKVADESSSRDIAALALTSRHFHSWVNPCLYEHNLKHENANTAVWAADKGRLETLLHLSRAQIWSSPDFVKKLWVKQDVHKRDWSARPDSAKFTLLHLAVRGIRELADGTLNLGSGHDDVVVWLLQQGANVEAPSKQLCDCPSVRWRSPYWTPLHLALCHSQEKTVKILLSHNASLQTRKREKLQALHTAAAHGLTSTILHLSKLSGFDPNVKDSYNQTPLHYAVKKRAGLTAIKALLLLGADVDGDDGNKPLFTPLYGAIVLGNFEAAVNLLKAGARPWVNRIKVAQVEKLLQDQTRTVGATRSRDLPFHLLPLSMLPLPLLHLAARTSKEFDGGVDGNYEVFQREIMQMLLDHGMDINARLSYSHTLHLREYAHEDMTPLMMAARHSSPTTVRMLLQRGALVNLRDSSDCSALCYAIVDPAKHWPSETWRKEIVKVLFDHNGEVFEDSITNSSIIKDLISVSGSTAQVLIDNMGPKILTIPVKVSTALRLCCIFQKREMYRAVKQNSGVEMQVYHIREILRQAARRGTITSVVAFLREMCPGPRLKRTLGRPLKMSRTLGQES
ncbi:hypothetical protein Daus18300_009550 [Diaporthe australafricana]|uniref:Uncharacterized protein n=1 Tax=Diaporthe australafricana TaxID=127596 RepID=A0ABR3WDU1_9PEZI